MSSYFDNFTDINHIFSLNFKLNFRITLNTKIAARKRINILTMNFLFFLHKTIVEFFKIPEPNWTSQMILGTTYLNIPLCKLFQLFSLPHNR